MGSMKIGGRTKGNGNAGKNRFKVCGLSMDELEHQLRVSMKHRKRDIPKILKEMSN